jgi:hypothetical protein
MILEYWGVNTLGTSMCNALYSLIDTQDKFQMFVNDKSKLSFYADFM